MTGEAFTKENDDEHSNRRRGAGGTMKTTATKERPILMSGPMVRASLDELKTQTRRIIRPQPAHQLRVYKTARMAAPKWGESMGPEFREGIVAADGISCPYGAPGDVLWVREKTVRVEEHGYVGPVYAESDDGLAILESGLRPAPDDVCDVEPEDIRCRPAIHMPFDACRLFLRVTSVRVERVQEISEADAKAEGVERHDDEGVTYYGPLNAGHADARRAFETLWDSINAERGFGWAANPWVWVVEFERIEKPADAGKREG